MPRRKRWANNIAARQDIFAQAPNTPVAVFFRPDAPLSDGKVIGSKIASLAVETAKIPKAINHEAKRVGLVIVQEPATGLYNHSKSVAETLFLVQAVPKNINVAVCVDGLHIADKTLRALVASLDTQIIYSDIDEYRCRAHAQGNMDRDEKSITGLFYLGPVAPEIANYVAVLSLATSVVNCCYAGRGVQAGVDWQSSVIKIANRPDRLYEMVDTASLGLLSLPDSIPTYDLDPWLKDAIYEHVMRSEFVRELDKTGRFRDLFHCRLLSGGDEQWETAAKNMKVIEGLWAKVPTTLDEPVLIEDINPDSEHVRDRLERLDEAIGVRSFIEAYLIGVPLEDLFA